MSYREQSIISNLESVAARQKIPVEDLLSFKLRAVRDRHGSPYYLGGQDYQALIEELDLRLERSDPRHHGRLLTPEGAEFFEHESGPEIVAAVAVLGNAISPYLSVIEAVTLVTGATVWLWNRLRKPPAPPRSRFIQVETRRIAKDGSLEETVVSVLDLAGTLDETKLATSISKRFRHRSSRPKARR